MLTPRQLLAAQVRIELHGVRVRLAADRAHGYSITTHDRRVTEWRARVAIKLMREAERGEHQKLRDSGDAMILITRRHSREILDFYKPPRTPSMECRICGGAGEIYPCDDEGRELDPRPCSCRNGMAREHYL